jgi:hypothetical protein
VFARTIEPTVADATRIRHHNLLSVPRADNHRAETAMITFAKRVFLIAGIYGLIVLVPQYFLADRIARSSPPALTHPEFFYGFIGIALAWQICFLLIARDPVRMRSIMIPAILEKLAWGIPVAILYLHHRLAGTVFAFGMIDVLLGVLFAIAYARTPARN